jgi:hypothetical protein
VTASPSGKAPSQGSSGRSNGKWGK